jgi:hypothetical protein
MSSCDAHVAGLNNLLDVVVYTDMYLLLRVQGCCRRVDQGHSTGEHADLTLKLFLHAHAVLLSPDVSLSRFQCGDDVSELK